jgi:hypothetical protein
MRVVKILAACGALLVLAGSPSPSAAADCASAPGDVDGDGLCDAHDPCEYGFALREGSLSLRRLGPPAGDDAVRVKGIMPLPERMVPDPSASGIRIVVLDGSWGENDVVLDVAAAPGPGWRVIVPGRSWSYRASDPASTGITRAVVKEIAPNAAFALPRQYAVVIDARRGTYGVTSDRESHVLSVAFAADGTTDVCAERAFYPWLITQPPLEPALAEPWAPRCRFRHGERTLACTSGPRVGPCRVSLPSDHVICDAQNAAAAEERNRAATGSYLSGPCSALPGFVPSPDVSCTVVAGADDFQLVTHHAGTASTCEWRARTTPSLACF